MGWHIGAGGIKENTVPTQLDLFTDRLPRKPYATNDFAYGLHIMSKIAAVKCRYIQQNHPATLAWLVFDVDHEGAAFRWMDANLPAPTFTVINTANGHAHLLYALATPVFSTSERLKPLRYAAAVQEAYRAKLDADPAYSGLICKNPLNDYWRVLEYSDAVYDLAYLAEWVDLATVKTRQAREEVGLGRNCTLFDRLRHWAYRWIATYKGSATASEWGEAVLRQAEKMNDFNTQLHTSEVRAIAKSTAKWTWTKFDVDASNERFSRLQAHRGRQGGIAKGLANEDKKASARLMHAQGQSYRQIADALGVSRRSVIYWCK